MMYDTDKEAYFFFPFKILLLAPHTNCFNSLRESESETESKIFEEQCFCLKDELGLCLNFIGKRENDLWEGCLKQKEKMVDGGT